MDVRRNHGELYERTDDTWFALAAITALHDPLAFDRLDALVWRPLPTPTSQLEADEYKAAIAIACIATPEAQTEAQNIAANHPSSLVRQLTAQSRSRRKSARWATSSS